MFYLQPNKSLLSTPLPKSVAIIKLFDSPLYIYINKFFYTLITLPVYYKHINITQYYQYYVTKNRYIVKKH